MADGMLNFCRHTPCKPNHAEYHLEISRFAGQSLLKPPRFLAAKSEVSRSIVSQEASDRKSNILRTESPPVCCAPLVQCRVLGHCMYVCLYVCMYVCMSLYVCLYVWMYVRMYVC